MEEYGERYLLISTHAPRTGSDVFAVPKNDRRSKFQPTLPARGATSLSHL